MVKVRTAVFDRRISIVWFHSKCPIYINIHGFIGTALTAYVLTAFLEDRVSFKYEICVLKHIE